MQRTGIGLNEGLFLRSENHASVPRLRENPILLSGRWHDLSPPFFSPPGLVARTSGAASERGVGLAVGAASIARPAARMPVRSAMVTTGAPGEPAFPRGCLIPAGVLEGIKENSEFR